MAGQQEDTRGPIQFFPQLSIPRLYISAVVTEGRLPAGQQAASSSLLLPQGTEVLLKPENRGGGWGVGVPAGSCQDQSPPHSL